MLKTTFLFLDKKGRCHISGGMGIPGFLNPFFTMGIPKLERWRQK